MGKPVSYACGDVVRLRISAAKHWGTTPDKEHIVAAGDYEYDVVGLGAWIGFEELVFVRRATAETYETALQYTSSLVFVRRADKKSLQKWLRSVRDE